MEVMPTRRHEPKVQLLEAYAANVVEAWVPSDENAMRPPRIFHESGEAIVGHM